MFRRSPLSFILSLGSLLFTQTPVSSLAADQIFRSEPYAQESIATQDALALDNARLRAALANEAARREKLDWEFERAREVHQRLFPQKLSPVSGLDYSGASRPALGIGGDYYDFLPLSNGQLGIAIGDVSGKGIPAALMMANLQASLRAEAMRAPGNPHEIVGRINRLVFAASLADRYATFFYAQYDPSNRALAYVNAGHNPPILLRKSTLGTQVERLDVGGTVVGLFENFPFQQATVTLDAGDLLVLYTDGITEAMNLQQHEWGEARMIETIEECRNMSAPRIVERVMAAADTFSGDAPQHDDMTLVAIRALDEAVS